MPQSPLPENYETPASPEPIPQAAGRSAGVDHRRDHSDSDGGLGGLLIGGAVGFLAGLAANPLRKAGVQGMEAAAGDWDDILKAEHKAVEKAFDKLLETSSNQTGRRQMLLTQIAHSLNKHQVTEENVIYPALRHHDREAANELGSEHLDLKAALSELQYDIDKDDPAWADRARELRNLIVDHARDEEERIFPAFKKSLSEDENASLNRRLHWEGLKVV